MKTINKIVDFITRNTRCNKMVLILFVLVAVTLSSCKKFLDIEAPIHSATPEQVFENDQVATSAITGIYSRMAVSTSSFSGHSNSIHVLGGLTSDELTAHSAFLASFSTNQIPTTAPEINTVWSNAYSYIYTCNAILKGLNSANGVTENTRKQLRGEAKFMRAFLYFYLVNLFGDVPLNLKTDLNVNETAARSSQDKIYDQIIADLSDAENLLSGTYQTVERIRPNKWAATALLSRVYLFTGNWDLASKKAKEVIDQTAMYSLVADLNKVFLKNSTEAIWQLQPSLGTNTQEGSLFVLTTTPSIVSLLPSFMNAFDSVDNRKLSWTNQFTDVTGTYYYPFKYKVKSSATVTEYSMVIRLAELYLIRAEAEARKGLVSLSLTDINVIRARAGLPTLLSGLTQVQCLAEIEKQRRFELFTEWGHRWLDLKRTTRATAVLGTLKGADWTDTDVLYPIPDNEVRRNPNMTQNLGY